MHHITELKIGPHGPIFYVVKVVGVEPTSESISERLSPSAADHLLFRNSNRRFGRLEVFLSHGSPMLLGAHIELSCINDVEF